MEYVKDFLNNEMVVGTFLAWLCAQVLKTLINWGVNKKFDPERIFGCGGFPSSHSATVCALATSVGINYGLGGYEFAMAFAFAAIVIYDALNVRLETGKQSVVINHLFTKEQIREILMGTEKSKRTIPMLKEYVGHTPTQILGGMIIGIAVACAYCLFEV